MIALCLCGCLGTPEVINPAFFQSLGWTEVAADVPGEAPAIIIEVENGADRVIEFRMTWRDADGDINQRTGVLNVGEKYSEALICPIEEMTLGDVSNLDATGAVVRLGGGTSNDPYLEVEPFGVLLQEGVNYDCGDVVTFTVVRSSATLSGYQSFAYIQRTGAQSDINTESE
jgi:hypothetical protein